ncbi:MAG: alpha-ketoacid dehydrogenase subunit beta [Elusimicrobia bacterium CG_4_10_14_0_2_um_filter_63_34]|nr:MAG: alpha-ketoacid dehydrogenase subunit beta [Elusimicrobia bacterium CG_4_10_14_0_2_um_filter_63_34]
MSLRELSYAQAIREAHAQLLAKDERVVLLGQGLWSPWYAGSSLMDLEKEFGKDRVMDTPVSENATTGMAVGAAITGLRPIVFHPRMDFMLLAVDPIVNQAANWSYLFSGKISAPVVFRATINRGGEQGAQHSQALQAMFAHIPGLKVVMPACPADAKGLMIAAVEDPNPVLYIDDRWLYDIKEPVGESPVATPIGKARIVCSGEDLTIISSSHSAWLCEQAAEKLKKLGVSVEVIDLRSVRPIDENAIVASLRKTGRLLVVDGAWKACGISAEIAAIASESAFESLKAPVRRLTLPDAPAPTSRVLEKAYYFGVDDIVKAALGFHIPRSTTTPIQAQP